jgi:hypothetical protein
MPKSKHRRKAGGKAVPHPGRQRAEPPGWVASQHHGPHDEAAGGLSQPAPQKDTAGLPLFAAEREEH